MNVGLYRGVAAMRAGQRRLEVISTNLANARSTAYKRTRAVQHGVRTGGRNGDYTAVTTTLQLDWRQGPLERTEVATDLALMGEGFFAIEGPEGEVYTRDGSFHLTDQGVLVTQEGMPVAWTGARGRLDPVGQPINVDRSGQVYQGQRLVGQLKLVDFPARDLLRQDRYGYFVASPALQRDPAVVEVHQGALEGANVSAIEELVGLIETQRAFEAGSNVMSMISQSYQRLTSLR